VIDGLTLRLDAEQFEALVSAVADRVLEQVGSASDRSPWLTATEAAEYLRWPLKRIYNLTAAGAIPHRKHEGRVLFHRDELDNWLDRHREGS
jgi:excisionase family DNA binding protein